MSATVAQPILVPNFAKLTRNMPTMQLPTFSQTPVLMQTPAPLPVQAPVMAPVLVQTPAPVMAPVLVQTPAPVMAPVLMQTPAQAPPTLVQTPLLESKESGIFQPIDFILDLTNLDTLKAETLSTQEQQYKAAGFSFKVPRVRTSLSEATTAKDLTRTLEEIERARPQGQKYTPLSHLSQEARDIIARGQTEYNELLQSRSTDGVKQHIKELEAWNNLSQKVIGADGQPVKVVGADGKLVDQEVPIESKTKILRDVFTLDFKTDDDIHRFVGDSDKKSDGLIKTWTKEHKKAQDKLSIRSKRQGLRLTLEIVFNGADSTTINPTTNKPYTISDDLVMSFNTLLQANSTGIQASYQRVTGEYKTKMVKDKKTGQLVAQDKKKPSEYVIDTVAKMDQWKAAAFMVNRLRNRFSDELHVAVTVFIDYLVKQFSQVAIVKCHGQKKARVMVKHVLENTHLIELFPLVSNFRSFQATLAKYNADAAKKLQGKTIGDLPEPEEKVSTKKHPFEYCVFAVCKQLTSELHAKNLTAGFDSILISSEYKKFMCEIVDELIQSLGPILRQEINSREVKTVNVDTFYSIIGALLTWHRARFLDSKTNNGEVVQGIKSYIEERVKRYEQYDEDEVIPEVTLAIQ